MSKRSIYERSQLDLLVLCTVLTSLLLSLYCVFIGLFVHVSYDVANEWRGLLSGVMSMLVYMFLFFALCVFVVWVAGKVRA